MLAVVFFAVVAIFVIGLLVKLYRPLVSSSRTITIPGMNPTHPKTGNLTDVAKSGGLHPFLMKLHETHGPISGFWNGETYTVSIASSELWKEHVKVFDRPAVLFKELEPLIGVDSIQFANGIDGRSRRKGYDRYFSHSACKSYFETFGQLAEEDIRKKWIALPPQEHIPIHESMMALALKGILLTGFGTFFKDEKVIANFNRLYDSIWADLYACSELSTTSAPTMTSGIKERQKDNIRKFHSVILDVIQERKNSESQSAIFVDFLLADGFSNEQILSDAVTYVIGGFHTTGNLLTWLLYFICMHEDVQEKMYLEFMIVLGKDTPVDAENIGGLKYTRQVIDESLRCSVLAPYAARYQDSDVEIGGHIIPKGTPVLHALGVVLQDQKLFPDPTKFDPERFSAKNVKSRPALSFSPFGFAGQRVCPAQKFAYVEVAVYLSVICRNFKLQLVERKVVTPQHTIVTKPDDEIWITVSKRDTKEYLL